MGISNTDGISIGTDDERKGFRVISVFKGCKNLAKESEKEALGG